MILPDLDLSLTADYQSAYVASTGGLIETRPISSQCLDGSYSFGDYGGIDGYFWIVSALSGQKDEFRRREFNEIETSIAYSYDWKLTKDVSLYNSVGHIWNPEFGYDSYDEDEMSHKVHVIERLKNPYLTPYLDVIVAYQPSEWVRLNTGLMHTFVLLDGDLSVTPFGHVIWGNENRYELKFATSPDSDFLGFTPMYLMSGVKVKYRVCDNVSVFLNAQQFDIVNAAGRRHERERRVPWARCDLPHFVVGVIVNF